MTSANLKAFLLMIQKSEGTYGPNAYRILFGGGIFNDFTDHPGQFFDYTDKSGKKIKTSASGAYQITKTTWTGLKKLLKLKDFSPASQDAAAIELIREAGALADIEAGRFDQAINKVRKIWASLPGSGNNQPEHSLAQARAWYGSLGGTFC